jgi:hypothetical protein
MYPGTAGHQAEGLEFLSLSCYKHNIPVCEFWGFHGSDYEECRPLGYKNPVHTSQQTHYISVTESSQLMLCKIWGFHGGD